MKNNIFTAILTNGTTQENKKILPTNGQQAMIDRKYGMFLY